MLNSKIKINPIIVLLTISDIFNWGSFFLVLNLAGLYLALRLDHDVVEMVGIGAALGYCARGILQIPVGIISDKIKKDTDEVYFLAIGTALMSFGVIWLAFVTTGAQYYMIQIVIGAGSALNLVDWRKLFAKSLDKGKEGMSYAVYDTAMSFSIAAFTLAGGIIANFSEQYFKFVILGAGFIMLMSNIWVFLIYFLIKKKH